MKKILLLSAYDALSHRVWHKTLAAGLPEYRWTVLTLPPRYFSWRIRGNALSWLDHPSLDGRYDLIVATSMTDLSALLGLRKELAAVPSVVYFHENQFDYPAGRGAPRVEAQMVTLYAALAADRVVFNSGYNMEGFLRGVGRLLRDLPDCVPAGVVGRIEKCCEVLPVPVRDAFFRPRPCSGGRPLTLLWNHRWEYDKGPDRLLRLAECIASSGLDLRLRIAGQQFRRIPPAFDRIRTLLGERILTWGRVDDADYPDTLLESDVVLSTATHDFQGLSVLEAVASGCVPLVPDRLAYPEWFDQRYRYRSVPDDARAEADGAMNRIAEYDAIHRGEGLDPPDVDRLSWQRLKPRYQSLLEGMF